MRHETATFGQKTQIQKFQLSFFFCISSLSTTKNTNISWNPYIYSVLANLKREVSEFRLKHRKSKNPMFAPFSEKKRLFLENCQIIGHKKHKMITLCVCARQKSLETTMFIGKKQLGPDNNLALFRSLCNKRQLSRKNKFDKLSGMFPALVFVAFWAQNFA